MPKKHIFKFDPPMNSLPTRFGAFLVLSAVICLSACEYSGDIYRNDYRFKKPAPTEAPVLPGAEAPANLSTQPPLDLVPSPDMQ